MTEYAELNSFFAFDDYLSERPGSKNLVFQNGQDDYFLIPGGGKRYLILSSENSTIKKAI
jgi:hypothetical protein